MSQSHYLQSKVGTKTLEVVMAGHQKMALKERRKRVIAQRALRRLPQVAWDYREY